MNHRDFGSSSYADIVRLPPSVTKEINLKQTNELFRKINGYDGEPLTVVRQFSCECCKRVWWKRVRVCKQVSSCTRCKIRYDPIAADKEFGFGQFNCLNCSKTFIGYIQMGHTSPCYGCKTQCFPSYILQKKESVRSDIRTGNKHSCDSCHGRGRCQKFKQILAFSDVHISTGSTLASLSFQGNLEERFIDDFDMLGMPGIRERSSDSEDEDESHSHSNLS